MVTESRFKHSNYIVKFSEIVFKNGIIEIAGDSELHHYINSHKI